MSIDRKELRRLCDAATPGPWEWWGDGLLDSVERGPVLEIGDDGKAYGLHTAVLIHNWDESAKAANKSLIAAARTAVPALLDALEAAEAREETLREALKNAASRAHAALAETAP